MEMTDQIIPADIKIAVIGGDGRQIAMTKVLAGRGFEIAVCGFDKYTGDIGNATKCVRPEDALRSAQMVILPLPYSVGDGAINCPYSEKRILYSDVIRKMKRGQILTGGKFDTAAITEAENAGIAVTDYFGFEELSILNAIPTAEGAAAIAMNELPITLHSSDALVLGFGRVGKTLAHTLKALGANVTCAARKTSDFAWMEVYGCRSADITRLPKIVREYDVIFNTVPEKIITPEVLSAVRKDTLIIDLASKPGGVDPAAADEYGIRVIWALSLPGKTAPETAGKYLSTVILNILKKEGVNLT